MLLLSVALLLLPEFLQRHSASSSSYSHCCPNCTISTARPIVAPCPPPSCRRPTLVLCERLVRPGLQNRVRRKPVFIPRAENENPKICGYNFSQWATYKGAPVLTSLQRRDWVGSDKVGKGQTTLEERQKKLWFLFNLSQFDAIYFPPKILHNQSSPCKIKKYVEIFVEIVPVIMMDRLFCTTTPQLFWQLCPKSSWQINNWKTTWYFCELLNETQLGIPRKHPFANC